MKRWQPFWLALAVASLLSLSVIWWESRPKPEPVKFGTPAEWRTYFSDDGLFFSIKYPDQYIPAAGDSSEYPTDSGLRNSADPHSPIPVAATLLLDRKIYPDTNLAGAWVSMAVALESNPDDCLVVVSGANRLTLDHHQAYNDIVWHESERGWVDNLLADGTRFETRVFHTLHEDKCYEITLNLATTPITENTPRLIKPVNAEEIKAQLTSIFYTFQTLEEPPTEE